MVECAAQLLPICNRSFNAAATCLGLKDVPGRPCRRVYPYVQAHTTEVGERIRAKLLVRQVQHVLSSGGLAQELVVGIV